MQCRDVRRLAESFVSGQLQVETNHALLQHLESCPECRAEIDAIRQVRGRVRQAFDAAEALQPRPEFAAELVARLRPTAMQVSRRSVLRSWWALAAGVVAAAGGGGLAIRRARERSRLASLARLAAGDHANCAVRFRLHEKPISMGEAGRRFGLPYRALTAFTPPGVTGAVLDRHACVYEGRRFAHVVFRHADGAASLLILDAAPGASPALESADPDATVASLPAGRYAGFIVVPGHRPEDALRLAHACVDPLASLLA